MKYGKELNAQSILKHNKNGHSNGRVSDSSPPFSQFSKKFCKILKSMCINATEVNLTSYSVSFSLSVEWENAYFFEYCEN